MLIATAARADIFKWEDAAGVEHYTNLKDEVPQQQAVQTVVNERARQLQGSSTPAAEKETVESEPAPEPAPAEAGDSSQVTRAYLEGLESGLARAGNAGGDVYVNTPVSVTVLPPAPASGDLLAAYDGLLPGYYPFVSGYLPLVSTSFNRHHVHRHTGRTTQTRHHGTAFDGGPLSPLNFISPAGPPPWGAAGPPPWGAIGPPPLGIAPRSTLWSGQAAFHQ
jgi:hypothetical protein